MITAASVAIAGVIVLAGRLSSPSVGTDGCSWDLDGPSSTSDP